ncbi:MAG: protein translocase subunit SecF [Chloroflexota bacterium]|nr:protein translocase subunit SecF [Chloroflexota bacterium]
MDRLASKRYVWFAISLIVIIPGLVSLVLFGLRFGIDFTGGTAWEIQFDRQVSTEAIKSVLADNGHGEALVQDISDGAEQDVFLIRMRELAQGSAEKQELTMVLSQLSTLNPARESLTTVGASVGDEIRNRAVLAVAVASVGILLYIAWAFRNTQNPFLYGIAAIIAMLHDALVVLGVFSILGEVANVEIDALFVTALLTVIGFSVHDTIVVFDRIRENLSRRPEANFEEIVNYSIAQTLVRSVNTSLTVVFTLLALYLFGGATTRDFVLALLIGVVSGTYSSIFNASQILVAWENGEIQRFFARIRRRGVDSDPSVAPIR